MTKLWDFPGGIHPVENKDLSTTRQIEPAGLPDRLILPLQQHIGAPAVPVVEVGEQVLKGQPLATVEGPVGVPVHAPTSGTIEAIGPHPVPHPSGMDDVCIFLRPDGDDRWCDRQPVADFHQLERADVLDRIRQAGIAGMGGAGFPTNIKLRPPTDRKVETLILNGAECEPYITADDMAMRERADQVAAGLRIMAWILRPQRCVIAIEDNKPAAIAAIRAACQDTQVEVCVIPTKYPSGGEKQLVQILTGLEVPHGGIPADIGVMCQNIGTAIAVHRAIDLGEPLISRITTVTGEAVANPGNFDTLLGTPIDHLLAQAGVQPERLSRLVLGGPMMGYTLQTTAVPVIKTTNCVIAATATELPEPPPEQPCIRCGMCAEVCPMDLLPQQLFWYAKANEFDKAEHQNLFDCIECGACTYVCPSAIPLVQYYRYAKGEIRTQQAEQAKADRARERFEARQARLEREQAEKEAKRKERARAAAEAQARKKAEAEQAQKAEANTSDAPAADERAAKAAMVQQALARKKANSQGNAEAAPKPAPVDREALEKQRDQARDKLAKMQDMLTEARSNDDGTVDKLERAVAKNEERLKRAEEALAQANESSPPEATAESQPTPAKAPASAEEIDSLKAQLEKARGKLTNMQTLLDEARADNADTVEKLERAVAKNRDRVKQAEEALAQAQAQAQTGKVEPAAEETPPAPAPEPSPPDLNALKEQLDKAQAKLETMQGLLDEARSSNGDNVDKLLRAVAKNEDRVQRARQALNEAKAQLATQDAN